MKDQQLLTASGYNKWIKRSRDKIIAEANQVTLNSTVNYSMWNRIFQKFRKIHNKSS